MQALSFICFLKIELNLFLWSARCVCSSLSSRGWPTFCHSLYKVKSSRHYSAFQYPLIFEGSRWLFHLYRHCLAVRKYFFRTMKQQFGNFVPFGGMISISKLTFEVLNNLFEQFLLFFSPSPTFTALTNRMALVFEQFGVFMVEHGGKKSQSFCLCVSQKILNVQWWSNEGKCSRPEPRRRFWANFRTSWWKLAENETYKICIIFPTSSK